MVRGDPYSLIDAMSCGAVIVGVPPGTADLKIRHVNASFCEMTGWLARDLVGTAPQTVWGAQFQPRGLTEALGIGAAWSGPIITHHFDRSAVMAVWQISPFADPASDGTSFLCVASDSGPHFEPALDSRRLDNAIENVATTRRRSDIVFGEIMRVAADAIIVIDQDHNIVEFNRGAEAMFGFTHGEAVGKPIDIVLPEHVRHAHAGYVRGFGERTSGARLMNERGEIAGRRRSGEEFPCQASIVRIDDGEGEGDGDGILYAAILRDQTEQKRFEAELQEARHRAEQANEAKSRFLATVGHELRTPLNAIIGFSDLLRAERLGPTANPIYQEYAEDLHSSGNHLLEIIDGIMNISMIDSGQIHQLSSEFQLKAAVDEIVMMLGAPAREKDLVLIVDIPGEIVVRADREILCQILVSLAGNSIKFSNEPGDIGIAAWIEPDGALALAVSDRGIGIPDDKLDDVVKPFFQVDSSDTRQHQGIGLGLSLVQRFTELHGGSFRIANNSGRGTTATVTLPASCVIEASPSA